MTAYRWASITLSLALMISGGTVAAQVVNATTEHARVYALTEHAQSRYASDSQDALQQTKQTEYVLASVATRSAMLQARSEFVSQVGSAAKAFTSAQGKVDTTSQKAKVLDSQQAVLSARGVAEIQAQTATVKALTAQVTESVSAYDRAAQARKSEPKGAPTPRQPNPGNEGWFAQMRSILNNIGGGHIALIEFGGSCGGGYSEACSRQGTIMVSSALANWSYSKKVWALTHELAHQYQFTVWNTLMASPKYQSLFRSDVELLANCMSASRGANLSGMRCSAEQVSWAGNIWRGIVAN